jgi:hypothetical protein
MTTPVAVPGPLFVTTIVYVRFCPPFTGSGESDFAIARSAVTAAGSRKSIDGVLSSG